MKKVSIHYGLLYLGLIMVLIPASIYIMSSDQKRAAMEKKVLSSRIVRAIPVKKQEGKLETITNESLANQEGKYAVYVNNLKTKEKYEFNSKEEFDGASLYKLWVMAVTFEKLNNGEFNKDEKLTGDMDRLEELLSVVSPTPLPEGFTPTPSAKENKKISMTVEEALEKMITVSDNYAALLLVSKIGNSSIVNFLKKNKFSESNFKQPPQTSARDIGLFFEKLYGYELSDKQSSDKMIDLLKKQALNDRLPKYLDSDIEVAHKTGELFGAKHDAGIVYAKTGDYVIVVLSDTKDYDKAAEDIARYSEEIYNYFNSKN